MCAPGTADGPPCAEHSRQLAASARRSIRSDYPYDRPAPDPTVQRFNPSVLVRVVCETLTERFGVQTEVTPATITAAIDAAAELLRNVGVVPLLADER